MDPYKSFINETYKSQDVTEAVHLNLNDSFINNSDVGIIAYNLRCKSIDSEHENQIYNPKNNPDRAIDISISRKDLNIRIFLDTKSKEWKSIVNNQCSLSPDQFSSFFKTNFYQKIYNRVIKDWPTSDEFYSGLCDAIKKKKVSIDPYVSQQVKEDAQFRKGNIDITKSREKNAAGQQIRTNSGRLIVTFSDFGVTKKDQAGYYCWPEKDKEFKFSQWNLAEKVYDPDKSNPMFLRMSFWHNEYEYGLNLGLRDEINDNRGFFGYNLTLEPPVQWTTPIETNQMIKLSIVQHFLSACKKRILNYVNMDTEEIYKRIDNPEKITLEQIENTKNIIKKNFDIVRDPRADTYIYD